MTVKAIQGAQKILFLGEVVDGTSSINGARLSLQTTHNFTTSVDSNSTTTKDGNINSYSQPAQEGSIENIDSEDPTNALLRKSVEKGATLAIWEVDLSRVGTGDNANKYPAIYYQGRVTKLEKDADADDNATQKADLAIDGIGQDGYVSIPANVVDAIQYAFRDLKVAPDPDGSGTGA